jgi:hypothetical protein
LRQACDIARGLLPLLLRSGFFMAVFTGHAWCVLPQAAEGLPATGWRRASCCCCCAFVLADQLHYVCALLLLLLLLLQAAAAAGCCCCCCCCRLLKDILRHAGFAARIAVRLCACLLMTVLSVRPMCVS